VRITGTRVVIAGDPQRAWLQADDMASLRISVVGPQGRPDLQWNAVVCLPAPSSFGVPFCDPNGPSIVCPDCAGGSSAAAVEPVLDFTVPDSATLGDAKEVLVLGAFCNGAPLDGAGLSNFLTGQHRESINPCMDPADEGEFLVSEIPIEQSDGVTNDQPTISSVFLAGFPEEATEGSPWIDDVAPGGTTPCIGMGLPEISTSSGALQLTLNLAMSSFESFNACPPDSCPALEVLQISWLATTGEFDGSFTSVTYATPLSVNFWIPPHNVSEVGGRIARFNIVAHDQRGGVDWITRALCVVPN
jgi:hypothetical protein